MQGIAKVSFGAAIYWRIGQMTEASNSANQEFAFMLAELKRESDLLNETVRRTDQVVSYYITFATALLAGTVLAVSGSSGDLLFFSLLALSLVAGVVGVFAFLTLVSLLGKSGSGIGHVLIRQRYFADRYPDVRRYINFRETDVRKESYRIFLNRGALVFLGFVAVVNSLLLSACLGGIAFWALGLSSFGRLLPGTSLLAIALAVGAMVLIASLALEANILSRVLKETREHVHSLFDWSTTEELRTQET